MRGLTTKWASSRHQSSAAAKDQNMYNVVIAVALLQFINTGDVLSIQQYTLSQLIPTFYRSFLENC